MENIDANLIFLYGKYRCQSDIFVWKNLFFISMVYNKKILTSIEPIFERATPILQRIYQSVKEAITNIITPPPAGTDSISGIDQLYETVPLQEPLLKKVNSLELIKHGYLQHNNA